MSNKITDGEVKRFCKIIKELRLGTCSMPTKGASTLNKEMFNALVIESVGLVNKIGWDRYKKYIDYWTLGIRESELTKDQLKIILKELK